MMKARRLFALAGLAAGILAAAPGCSSLGKIIGTANAPVASQIDTTALAQRIYQAKAGYGSILAFATIYAKQPRCTAPGAPPAPACSSQTALNTMLKLSAAADAATQGAEDVIRNTPEDATVWNAAVASAEESVKVFKQVVAIYKPEAAK